MPDSSVVYQNIDTTKTLNRRCDQLAAILVEAHIRGDAVDRSLIAGGESLQRGLQTSLFPAADEYAGALQQQSLRDAVADSPRASGDNRDFVLQFHALALFQLVRRYDFRLAIGGHQFDNFFFRI